MMRKLIVYMRSMCAFVKIVHNEGSLRAVSEFCIAGTDDGGCAAFVAGATWLRWDAFFWS